ncbi:MAG: hypothetical protein ACE5KE_09400 [Methanosarcinales archaeon]
MVNYIKGKSVVILFPEHKKPHLQSEKAIRDNLLAHSVITKNAKEWGIYVASGMNNGEHAYASVEHLHSQALVFTDSIPYFPYSCQAYHFTGDYCTICDVELANTETIIKETNNFSLFVPDDSALETKLPPTEFLSWQFPSFPFAVRIAPKHHYYEADGEIVPFKDLNDIERAGLLDELAKLLKETYIRIALMFDTSISYNVTFVQAPFKFRDWHFYCDVIPRHPKLFNLAVLELTGRFSFRPPPEKCASEYRRLDKQVEECLEFEQTLYNKKSEG